MADISFKPLSMDHIVALHKWMQEPHVLQWWGGEDHGHSKILRKNIRLIPSDIRLSKEKKNDTSIYHRI